MRMATGTGIRNTLSTAMEGAQRPGHFDGVLTVVLKLLQIASADRAYFGEKDWQQLILVQGMTEAFFLPTRVVACPTVREPDGLALSSRNRRLPPQDRERAPHFHRILSSARSAEAASELRASGFTVDYVEDRDRRRLGAVRLGGIDSSITCHWEARCDSHPRRRQHSDLRWRVSQSAFPEVQEDITPVSIVGRAWVVPEKRASGKRR